MPTPTKYETKEEYIKRCVPHLMKDGTAKSENQAYAICFSLWNKFRKNEAEINSIVNKYLTEDEMWSGKVKVKWHPPEGLFTKDAETIATTLRKKSKTRGRAMKRLVFYINRAGKNLSSERKKELEKAKEILKNMK